MNKSAAAGTGKRAASGRGSAGGSGRPTARRAAKAAERRDAILEAALEEFALRGFAGARLEDVAARAGVAKGTIYLYFRDKEELFQELVRGFLVPQVAKLEASVPGDVATRDLLAFFVDRLIAEVYDTRRRDVLRLMLTEGHRFPQLAEFYYREVVERAIAAMRLLLRRAVARGELANDALVKFPQLLIAPMLMGVVWSGLFARFEALDIRALMQAHLDALFGERNAP